MTTGQTNRLEKAQKEVLGLVEASVSCDMNYHLDREIFFAHNRAINRIIEAMEDEVTCAEDSGNLTNNEYRFWSEVIDSLRKL